MVGEVVLECENCALMVNNLQKRLAFVSVLLLLVLTVSLIAAAGGNDRVYLPFIGRSQKPIVEVRGLWITRFDWTNYASADSLTIDDIVANAASAGFNVLFFQVRGEADAYYTPGLEPWARRLSGTLGQDPGWDPLARLIQEAHQRGLQVHAYLNVYPVWANCDEPPADNTAPRHLYHRLLDAHGETGSKPNGLMWDGGGLVSCSGYQRATPASPEFNDHMAAVAKDLVQRYDIDGLHLDHIRYGGRATSCDPVSAARFGAGCFNVEGYEDWQRGQVNGTVRSLYETVRQADADVWLTAAVWPVYRDIWGWGASSGYDDYYQDPKAWMAAGTIDAVSPMIYRDNPDCNQPYYWTQSRWELSVQDYLDGSSGRWIIPGIGTSFCTEDDFAEIEARIKMGRALGTAGHAIFSYSSLKEKGYFDDLAAGPYHTPAELPERPWR